jgi:hypothetical protein
MLTACFRKMAIMPSPMHKQPPAAAAAAAAAGGAGARVARNGDDTSLKSRVADLLSNSGLQARALELVEHMSFSDSGGVLHSIAQVWTWLIFSKSTLLSDLIWEMYLGVYF